MNYNTNNIRVDVFRPTTSFSDVLRVVAANYEMYNRAYDFMGPWIAKQNGNAMLSPSKEIIADAVGKPRSVISQMTYSKFVDSLFDFAIKSAGRKALITPNPTTHHSAQFSTGAFKITKCDKDVTLRDDKNIRRKPKTLHELNVFGADAPLYIENLGIDPDKVKFVILRPKLGKLGTASVSRWEALLFTSKIDYLINHTDSDYNPRYSGIL